MNTDTQKFFNYFGIEFEKADTVIKRSWVFLHDREKFNEFYNDYNISRDTLLALLLLKNRNALAHFMHPFNFDKETRHTAAHYIDVLDNKSKMLDSIMLDFVDHGCLLGLKQMVEYGANIHFMADYALLHSMEQINVPMTKYILENFDHSEFSNDYTDWIRIQAVKSNNLEIVKLIIEKFGSMKDLELHCENTEIIDYLRSLKRHRK